MASDLADQIDDYICSFEGVGDSTMDTIAMLIFAWAVLALISVWLCQFLYKKYIKKSDPLTIGTIDNKTAQTPILTPSATVNHETNEKLRKSEPKEIFAKESLVRNVGRGVIKSGLNAVPSTPTLRKRLSRKSPGPELKNTKKVITPPANVVGPDTVSVTWTSQVFRWLYTDLVIVNEMLHSWVQALNLFCKKLSEEHGITVEIIRILPESPPPTITNLFCNNEANPSDLVVTWDCDCMPVLQIKAMRQKSGKVEISHYKATVSRYRGHSSTKINYLTLKGEMKIGGYPDIRIALNSIGPIKGDNHNESQLQELVVEILINAIRGTVYPIDFSVYSTCPRALKMDPSENPVNVDTNDDALVYNVDGYSSYNDANSLQSGVSAGKRLLVKVVKGEGLIRAADPYCVVEMDEPPQKNQTGARQGMNPYWDEHFLFDLSPNSAEILFEIYDRPSVAGDPARFLGLGLVGIDELSVGPSSSQVLSLQPRPYETEKVSGAITVEFVFIEGPEIPAGRRPYKLKDALKINTNTSQSQPHPIITNGNQHGKDVADAAIRAIERGALSTSKPSKSTLIIHSVQRESSQPVLKVALNEQGLIHFDESQLEEKLADKPIEKTDEGISIPTDSLITESFDSADVEDLLMANGIADKEPGDPNIRPPPRQHYTNGHSTTLPRDMGLTPTSETGKQLDDLERGRTRKKRDFFGTLKKRLGRSKTRTKSADREMIPIYPENLNGETRSISADRGPMMNNNSSTGARLIVPTLDQSRRSSLSESSAISGLSSASNRTYTHEASTLVLETIENGVKRHFLVPLAIAQRPRWRRKGTKLHIYNDHTFVAKHLNGGLTCDICNRSIPRRPGKQGYECRDCLTKCHKQCHVRAPQACKNATVLSIELSKLNSAAADRSIRKL